MVAIDPIHVHAQDQGLEIALKAMIVQNIGMDVVKEK